MPRTLAPLILLLGCTDYGVTRSELSDEIESDEVTLVSGGSAEVVLLLDADAEALAAKPTNRVDITVFALREDLTPTVQVTAGDGDPVTTQVLTVEYIELTVDDPLRNCTDPDGGGPEAALAGDGACEVRLPVSLAVIEGTASLQVTAHYELSFGRQEPPGEMSIAIE